MSAKLSLPVIALLVLGSCATPEWNTAGTQAISHYGCGSCHTISGIRSAKGRVGPPLVGLKDRMYVAGMLQNTPENLIHWIQNPKAVNPKTAMPNLGVSDKDARAIATYLYLR